MKDAFSLLRCSHGIRWAGLALAALALGGVPRAADGQIKAGRSPLVVTLDDNYPPYVFRDADGHLKGILPDQWALWEKKTGVKVELQAMEWGKAQQFMREGHADVIDTIFITPERLLLYDFTPAYARIQVPIYAHKTLGGIGDISSLKGFTVGVKAGDAVIGHLNSRGIDTLKEYPSYEDIILAAKNQEIKVFSVDQPAAVYYMYKHGLAGEFRMSFVLYTGEFHRAVEKNRADLLNLVQSGFSQITTRERRAIDRRWMGTPFLLREIVRQWGLYLLLAAAIVLGLAALNAVLSIRVRSKTAELRQALADLQQSQVRVQSILQVAPVGIGITSDRHILEVNEMLCKLSGYAREELVGQSTRLLYGTQEDFEQIGKRFFEQISSEGHAMLEAPIRHRDGHMMYWWLTGAPIDPARANAEFIFTAMDITGRKQAEEDRLRYELRTQEAQKLESLGLLAGGIAHDFNNLLAAIMGNLELALLALPKDAQTRDDILAAVVSTKRAAELVQQMLAYSGQSRFVIESLDVAAMLHRTMQLVRSSVPANIQVQLRVPPAVPDIDADESQLRQVIMDLVANAVESMETRPGTIDLSADVMDSHQLPALPLWPHSPLPPGTYVCISVADTGIGIPADQLGKIFEPFYTTKFTGRGLGLPAVLGIVRGHKGAIQVDSAPGKGSAFRLLFPAKHAS